MRKILPRLTTAWVLMLTYSALFILLVISRNHQFWNQRKASATLIELVPKANERQSVFTNLYKSNIEEETAILQLSYSLYGNENKRSVATTISQIKSGDSLFAIAERFITNDQERELFKKLKEISSEKKKYEQEFFEQIREEKYDETIKNYENKLSPLFTESQQTSSRLLDAINARDKAAINDTREEIIRTVNLNIWISIGLVILLISLGVNLVRIVKTGRSTTFALKASELKFRNFFNLAPIPIWVIDPETNKFMSVNKAACKLYGYSENEFLNMTIFDIRKAEDISKEYVHLQKVKQEILNLEQDTTEKIYSDHFKKNGEKIEAEVYASPIVIKDKKRIISIVIDVSERNHFENKITKAIIKTQEDERYEIGTELHDNVCQILAAAKMRMGMIRPSLVPSVMEHYDQSCEAILMATKEIRNLSHRLAPAFFNNTKLEVAFQSLLKSFSIQDGYEVAVNFDQRSKEVQIPQDVQLNLYRILQEQVRNIIRYAQCTKIEVSVFIDNDKLHMKIADNGIGFDVHFDQNGIGFANMKRRAELFSGKWYVNSSKGKGCEVTVIIPLNKTIYTEEAIAV